MFEFVFLQVTKVQAQLDIEFTESNICLRK